MIISCWNIRGYNDPLKHGFVRNHVCSHKVDIMCLLETRVRLRKEESLLRKWRKWKHDTNTMISRNGRIWLLWREEVQLTVLHKTSQFIHCTIKTDSHGPLYFSFIYAANHREERLALWNELKAMRNLIDKPWCIIGDFNAVTGPMEVHSPNITPKDQSMSDLENFISDTRFIDHPATGSYFTWSNRRTQDLQLRKLDRIIVNELWIDKPNFSKA